VHAHATEWGLAKTLQKQYNDEISALEAGSYDKLFAPAAATAFFLLRVLEGANSARSFALPPTDPPAARGTVEALSALLFADRLGAWSFLFLVVGLLLLSAVVGAVLLAKHHLDRPSAPSTPRPGGH